MPEPARVYCDFENNYPNFYLDSVEGIRITCGELGLEPTEIKSEGAFLKMI